MYIEQPKKDLLTRANIETASHELLANLKSLEKLSTEETALLTAVEKFLNSIPTKKPS